MTLLPFPTRAPTVDGDELLATLRASIADTVTRHVAASNPWQGFCCRFCRGKRPAHRRGCDWLHARVYVEEERGA